MKPERWQEIKKVLAGALGKAPEDRRAYLDQSCPDADLRREVESLIAAHEQGESNFMESPDNDGTLHHGTKLGPYEIVSPIGAGAMGEVYRARDAKLRRDVAIKVLPPAFANVPHRLARFQREARLLASLNHPNIAAIYGAEDSDGAHALVMELVQGPTLAERIAQGPIPIDEALSIANQIAEGLEYAHEHGIVHRDLKPANIKASPDGTVKILDFGLAKAMETGLSPDTGDSPTLSQMATQEGALLGTATYMSPEQAKAKPVDRRADIWAFGCVLYEMLTGKLAFPGETITEALAAVLNNEPDWSQIPATTPRAIHALLRRCLQKDLRQRLQAIGDARLTIEEVVSGAKEPLPASAPSPSLPFWPRTLPWAVASVFVLATALLAFLHFHRKPSAGNAMRFEIPLPSGLTGTGAFFTLSPDGRKLAFFGVSEDGQRTLWLRSLDSLKSHPLAGTEGVRGYPFWSSDSRFIAFFAHGKLEKIDASGGPPVALCDTDSVFGGSSNGNGTIIFGSPSGTMEVSASGGSAVPVTTGAVSVTPSFLPDGRHFVYMRDSGSGNKSSGFYVGSINTKPGNQSSRMLLAAYSFVFYAPSSDPAVGYLLFTRGSTSPGSFGTLVAQPFDTRGLKLTGEAIPLAQQVSNRMFSVSATDDLVYATGAQTYARGAGRVPGRLAWFNREGKILRTFGDPGVYGSLALSPDGRRVAFERVDPQNVGNVDIWLYDFSRGVSTRFTFDPLLDINPVWSPDGRYLAFSSNRTPHFDLYEKASNLTGQARMLFKSGGNKIAGSWSPDGHFLLYLGLLSPQHIWLLPLGGKLADRKPVLIGSSRFNHTAARFSPNGRWIVYSSDESGRNEIYVRSFDPHSPTGTPPGGGKWQVSTEGGMSPLWRRDGKELFYLSLNGQAMAVNVSTTGTFRAEVPKVLFKVPRGVVHWDVSPDGKRFLMAKPSSTSAAAQPAFRMVLNWQAGLNR